MDGCTPFKKKKRRVAHNYNLPVIIVDSPEISEDSGDCSGDEASTEEQEKSNLALKAEDSRKSSLRRNSISLPNLDNLQLKVLEELHEQAIKASDNGIRSDYYNSENEFSDLEDYSTHQHVVPLRHARRKSITISPRMLKPPGDDESCSNSPANSITSINSLASLLREKMQMLPSQIKKKKPKDYKIRAFVGFLFLTIVFLVGLAYVLYHQKVLQRAYFDKIKFNKVKRVIKIYNSEGLDIIRGRLGTTLSSDKAYSCLPADKKDDGSICMEWVHRARLYLYFYELNPEVRCYNLKWISLSDEVEPTDCLEMSGAGVHWYGGGQTADMAWPLEKGLYDFAPFVTGRIDKQQWGNVLKRYFINSKGAAIVVDNKTPLYVALKDGENGKELCLKAKFDDFAYVNHLTEYPQLNYSICTSTNMTKLHSVLSEKSLWDGLKESDKNFIDNLLSDPLWQITSKSKEDFTEMTVSKYADNVKVGHVLINEFWQKHVGDFTVDQERFPSLEKAFVPIKRRGFRIVFSIQPFISTESANFAEAVEKRLLVSERFSDRRIPALTRYKSSQSAGVLDVTNNRTIPWLLEKLKLVMNEYQFDAYYLDLGEAYNMPHYYQCEKTLHNPDHYKTIFINSLQTSLSLFGVSSAIERPRAPIFVSLPMVESSWNGIRTVIPTILTYGLIGYPFLIPGAVGGDYEKHGAASSYKNKDENILLPDKELYMRWWQLATFLPVIRFTHLPSYYGDNQVLEMAEILTSLRQTVVIPLLQKYAQKALDSGLPLIRPLWMLEPHDQACHIVADEFSVGEELIVAPVLYSGAREREVYLPAGVWRDGIDGSLRKGSRWIHDYKVEENQIAYFMRMPDNTRF